MTRPILVVLDGSTVLAEIAPVTAQERAEALNIAGLYVRRSRLVELEALALSHGTHSGKAAAARELWRAAAGR